MPIKTKEAIRRAVKNIVRYGDTDIFPFPLERYVFEDKFDHCVQLLMERHREFEKHRADSPPLTIEALTQVGYSGFRRATQIEPFWNAYYLALVVSIAKEIEDYRIPVGREIVYSYRYKWNKDNCSLFQNSTWHDFRLRARQLCERFSFVVLTDIADFYPRINHHRLENLLGRLPGVGSVPASLDKLLSHFSHRRSYGLPVGGPASRILAELSLADVDMHLDRRGIRFCRYADDYAIFSETKAASYDALILLSEKLLNEGLSLQKTKTKILSTSEFLELQRFLDPRSIETHDATEEQKLLNVSIRFDPYSSTAHEDYEELKGAVEKIDVLGILSREVDKISIDQTVAKQAIAALRVLDSRMQEGALRVLLDSNNLLALSPVFVSVMRAVRGIFDALTEKGKTYGCNSEIDSSCGTCLRKRHYIVGDHDLVAIGLGEQRPSAIESRTLH